MTTKTTVQVTSKPSINPLPLPALKALKSGNLRVEGDYLVFTKQGLAEFIGEYTRDEGGDKHD